MDKRGGGDMLLNFDSLPECKKKLIRRNQRRQEIQKKMSEDPNFKPKHFNAKLSYQDCERIRELFCQIPGDDNLKKARADFIKKVCIGYGVHEVTVCRLLSKKRRLVDTDLPSLNELKDRSKK